MFSVSIIIYGVLCLSLSLFLHRASCTAADNDNDPIYLISRGFFKAKETI